MRIYQSAQVEELRARLRWPLKLRDASVISVVWSDAAIGSLSFSVAAGSFGSSPPSEVQKDGKGDDDACGSYGSDGGCNKL